MIVDGVELLRLIRDGEIRKNKTTIKRLDNDEIYYFNGRNIDNDDKEYTLLESIEDIQFVKTSFEISEPSERINIQEIEEIDIWSGYNRDDAQNITKNTQKINELIKAIKQLDKKIK